MTSLAEGQTAALTRHTCLRMYMMIGVYNSHRIPVPTCMCLYAGCIQAQQTIDNLL